jgi:B12-binding domain/radical SAM domain protein
MVKKQHPDKPVIFGGLSSTYFHREIMTDYPFVDFIVCGDSTEEPLRMLMNAIKNGGDYRHIPNLVWRNSNGEIVKNEISHRPPDLDTLRFDYSHLLKMALRYRDPSGYIPFRHWLSYPVSAVFQCRGCFHNCASCGGSLSSFKKLCMRDKPSFRSPELLAEDIRRTADLTGAPIFVIGDLLQAGEEYASRFLETIKGYHVRNGITLEFFVPPPEAFLERVAASIENFNIEMSPESHDPKIRKIFGKTYSNEELEEALEIFIKHGCTRVDLFFMVGLPYQDYASIMETVAYCERLLGKCRSPQKLLPMISPLAPFIDPGSNIFENPEKFGYRLFYQTLREHREASLKPSWKYTLNYETTWMTRDDIVRATYDSASMLTDIKAKYGIIGKEKARAIVEHIKRAKDLIARIDRSEIIDDSLKTEIMNLNTVDSLCDKHELEWPVKGARLNVFNVLRMLLFRPPRIACAE